MQQLHAILAFSSVFVKLESFSAQTEHNQLSNEVSQVKVFVVYKMFYHNMIGLGTFLLLIQTFLAFHFNFPCSYSKLFSVLQALDQLVFKKISRFASCFFLLFWVFFPSQLLTSLKVLSSPTNQIKGFSLRCFSHVIFNFLYNVVNYWKYFSRNVRGQRLHVYIYFLVLGPVVQFNSHCSSYAHVPILFPYSSWNWLASSQFHISQSLIDKLHYAMCVCNTILLLYLPLTTFFYWTSHTLSLPLYFLPLDRKQFAWLVLTIHCTKTNGL